MKTKAVELQGMVGERSKLCLEGCQIPGYQRISEGDIEENSSSLFKHIKRTFARPWNYDVKPRIKRLVRKLYGFSNQLRSHNKKAQMNETFSSEVSFQAGDLVRVRAKEEIESTLDPFKELKGCAFLETMWQYCGTTQRVLQPVERFLDERDYKVKKASKIVLLDGVLCRGTPVFGRCDRCCHLFWREEWLEKINGNAI